MLMIVDQLHGIGVFVQAAAVNCFVIFGDNADWAVNRHHYAGRVRQRLLERAGRAKRTDVAQIRRHMRAFSVHAMTRHAAPALVDSVWPRAGSPSATAVPLKSRIF